MSVSDALTLPFSFSTNPVRLDINPEQTAVLQNSCQDIRNGPVSETPGGSPTLRHILLITTFVFLAFLWDVEFRLRRIFRSSSFYRNISARIYGIPAKILSLTRFFLDFDVHFEAPREFKIPKHCLIISNHQSILDIPILAYCFPRNNVRFVAKHSLFTGVPLVSQVLRIQRHARIDRKGRFSLTMKELERLAREAKQGLSPIIFPEGTRSKTGALGRFHIGAVRKIEHITPLPILVVALNGGYRAAKMRQLLGALRGKRYRVKALSIYPPPEGKGETEDLMNRAREEIIEQVALWQSEEP